MKINLTEIYAGLKAYRHERVLTAENQKAGYIVNVMEELGELAEALRDFEKIKNGEQVVKKYIASEWNENNAKYALIKYKKVTLADAEHSIIDALCDISVYTINAGADIPCEYKLTDFDLKDFDCFCVEIGLLIANCGTLSTGLKDNGTWYYKYFGDVLIDCAKLCEKYGFNFEVAMLETIREISSRTGKYDENAKKWGKDESDEAKAKWYKADFEKARIEK